MKKTDIMKEAEFRQELERKKGKVKASDVKAVYDESREAEKDDRLYLILRAVGEETDANVAFEKIIMYTNLLGVPDAVYSAKKRKK